MKNKKILSIILCLVMILGAFNISIVSFGEDLVAINATNFPDDSFRTIVSQRFDTNSDGYLSATERNQSFISITGYTQDGLVIKSLKGIEHFTSLNNLRVGSIGLEQLDVSLLKNLTALTCEGNSLTSLDVSGNPQLQFLDCCDNLLTSLKLGNNPNLTELYCEINNLTALDVTGLTGLVSLNCYQNKLTTLNLSNNTALEDIACAYNHLKELDLSNNTSIIEVSEDKLLGQVVSANAVIENGYIAVPFSFNQNSTVTWTSVDVIDESNDVATLLGYRYGRFIAYDVKDIDKVIDEALPQDVNVVDYGIEYKVSTNNPSCADMSVNVEVSRDFYQVDFYTGEDMLECMYKSFVPANTPAANPSNLQAPICKELSGWSEDISVVSKDMKVYPIWQDVHNIGITSFDGITVNTNCQVCSNVPKDYVFKSHINAKTGDAAYVELLDVVKDGVINAKDYAQLMKLY